jgi:hypothetical protein
MVYRIAILLLGIIGYGLTIARSLSFWDCGEYIAASSVLGIVHPPGNPLFVMLGRVFILLFGWWSSPAFAVNLISAISSIFCCLLIFEITMKILPQKSPRSLAFFAASISLFGNTFWFNAVEAGAYGISMCVIMLQIWAALKWKETGDNKFLLFIAYIAFLGIGFHTFCLLPLPAIFIFVLLKKRIFPIKFFFSAAFLIVLGLSSELYLPIRSSTEPILNENNPAKLENFLNVLSRKQYGDMNMFERALYRRAAPLNQFGFSENIGYLGYHLNQWLPAPLGAQNPGIWAESSLGKVQFFHRIIFEFLLIAVFAGVWLCRKSSSVLLIAFLFLLSSVGLVLYLNLADGTRTDSYNAKQWSVQIKELRKFVPDSIPNLPNTSELNAQFSFYTALPAYMREMWVNGASKAKGVKTFLHWQEALEEQGKEMATLPEIVHREVRNRDYFFTPAFLFFAIMAAVACGAWLQRINSARWKKIAICGIAFVWLVPFISNFSSHNRSQDFIARDFAMNALNSVPQNGILITYGDNDTFPLWYMQMAENYRRDVVVINESLSYSEWYREQVLKRYPDLGNELTANGKGFIKGIIENNWPNRSVNFMIGANPRDYREFSENMPLIGLVRNLGMDEQKADSLLIANLTKNYRYSELNARGQEANEQTIAIYRYLVKLAIDKNPSEEEREFMTQFLRL